METEDFAADAALFARMRAMWEQVDPVPADLVDRMVAAVAVEDLSREYALLTLVSGELAAVRGETDTADAAVHATATRACCCTSPRPRRTTRRIDGWVDATALAVRLVQGDREWSAELGEHGRFAFDGVKPGVSRIRLVVRGDGRPAARVPDPPVRSVTRRRDGRGELTAVRGPEET